MAKFEIPDKGVNTKPGIIEQVRNELGKYGVLAFILFIFGLWTTLIVWNADRLIDRIDKQIDMSNKIGVLEGRLNMLLNKDKFCE